ncbi:MAG TPA: peptidoglycan-binding protein [Reyranella sp.]|nr:peptidoglycan-binding protein [Reyranella sp.]
MKQGSAETGRFASAGRRVGALGGLLLVLSAFALPAQAQSFDDAEAQLRIRQASTAVTESQHEVDDLRKALKAEQDRVLKSKSDIELNAETIKTLEKNLKAAEAKLQERSTALAAAQEERRKGLAALNEEEKKKQEALAKQAPPPPPAPPPVAAPPQPTEPEPVMSQLDRQKLQVALAAQGFDPGTPDGQIGPRTREMIAGWQRKRNEPATGFITKAQLASLLQASAAAVARFEQQLNQQQTAAAAVPAPSPAPSSGDATTQFFVTNKCPHPVTILLRYRDVYNNWQTEAWWRFAPSEASFLAVRDVRITSRNTIWYYYAAATDGSGKLWTGDHAVAFGGRTYQTRKIEDTTPGHRLTLTCT